MRTFRTESASGTAAQALAALRANTSIIAFGLDDWNSTPQTRQHVLSGLAAHKWPVTYTNGPHFVWEVRNAKWRYARWKSRAGHADDVKLNWPGRFMVRWPRFSVLDRMVVRQYIRTLIRQSSWSTAQHRIAYLFHPSFQQYVQELGECHVVYHADDSFSKMPEWTKYDQILEEILVKQASLLVASSPGVARNLPLGPGTRARVLENGAPVDLFMKGADERRPLADLQSIPRPRIGYFGCINPKVDLNLADRLAALEPGWHWVFVGHCSHDQIMADESSRAAWLRLQQRSNVHFIGQRRYDEMPGYQAEMDVNVLCYRTDPGGWWTDLSPLKLYEYLAVGVPVVSSPLEVLSPVQHVVATADGEHAWFAALAHAIHEGGVGTRASRREAASSNDWNGVVTRLDSWLVSLLQSRVTPQQKPYGRLC